MLLDTLFAYLPIPHIEITLIFFQQVINRLIKLMKEFVIESTGSRTIISGMNLSDISFFINKDGCRISRVGRSL